MLTAPLRPLLLALLATVALSGCHSSLTYEQREEQRHGLRLRQNRVWDGYYTAAFNHRYCLRLTEKHPDEADRARMWRELQSDWRPLRYHAVPDVKRIERLEQRQDRLEETEDAAHYDDKLASEVQAELDRFLGAKR